MDFKARTFVQESYDDSDALAKDKMTQYLIRRGHTILSSEENFEHDIITKKDGMTHYFEVEVKTNYVFVSKDTFVFKTVSFLGRKLRLHDIHPFHYVIMCRETEYAVTCPSFVIFNPEYIETLTIETEHRSGLDQMYRVPKGLCTFFNINA